jgi:hypothetical protein
MIDKINNSQIQDILGRSSCTQPESAKARSDSSADVSIQVDYASLINKAAQIPQSGADAIRKARELLLLGELENPQNIRAVAEDIIKFGI